MPFVRARRKLEHDQDFSRLNTFTCRALMIMLSFGGTSPVRGREWRTLFVGLNPGVKARTYVNNFPMSHVFCNFLTHYTNGNSS